MIVTLLFQLKRKRWFDWALSGEIIAQGLKWGGLLHSFTVLLFVVAFVIVGFVFLLLLLYLKENTFWCCVVVVVVVAVIVVFVDGKVPLIYRSISCCIHWIGFILSSVVKYKCHSIFSCCASRLKPDSHCLLHCVLTEVANLKIQFFANNRLFPATRKLMDQHFWQMSLFVPDN